MRSVTRRNRQQTAVNGGLSAAVTMKVVNRLVKVSIRFILVYHLLSGISAFAFFDRRGANPYNPPRSQRPL